MYRHWLNTDLHVNCRKKIKKKGYFEISLSFAAAFTSNKLWISCTLTHETTRVRVFSRVEYIIIALRCWICFRCCCCYVMLTLPMPMPMLLSCAYFIHECISIFLRNVREYVLLRHHFRSLLSSHRWHHYNNLIFYRSEIVESKNDTDSIRMNTCK